MRWIISLMSTEEKREKMRARVKRLLAVLCGVVMMCSSGMGLIAHAEEIVEVTVVSEYEELTGDNVGHGIYDIPDIGGARAETLANCSISIGVNANGVTGTIKTGSTVQASTIGAENIKLEKKVNGKWVQIGDTMSGSVTNDDTCVLSVTTSSAEKGVEYRITCTHFAYLSGVKRTLYNETGGVKY